MPKDEPFYDNPKVHKTYLSHRSRPDNPNDALERPLFLELAGDLTNLDIIDLGCGDASFGKEALQQGARSYTGFEVSKAMVDTAQATLANTSGEVRHESLETWQAEGNSADLVASRLALNYVENIERVFQEIAKALRSDGRAVLSVEHPIITSDFTSLADGQRTAWQVDNYFKSGARVHTWLGEEITKYHHTLEEWLELVEVAGLELERVRESRPRKENFHSREEYERRLRIPLFLFMVARKP